ncbi:FAD binding domain-containing protein [Acuticoccus sp. I52.16.1]|uniref:FAD binding domain-containing protein n=1 Tax=Acuticoccus sp. I52.16.1 TaxID=2928472 RepID=UPI00352FA0DD
MPLILTLLCATLRATGPKGWREIPADAFFTGLMETALGQGETLVEIEIPHGPQPGAAAPATALTKVFLGLCSHSATEIRSSRLIPTFGTLCFERR